MPKEVGEERAEDDREELIKYGNKVLVMTEMCERLEQAAVSDDTESTDKILTEIEDWAAENDYALPGQPGYLEDG